MAADRDIAEVQKKSLVLKIREVTVGDPFEGTLHKFAERHHLLFNAVAWTKIYPAGQIHQCVILNNNDEVIGCFNYYTFRKAIFRFVITPPFAPSIGLFYVNPAESIVGRNSFDKELISAIADYFKSLEPHFVDINLPYGVTDTQPFTWKGFESRHRYSYICDLSLSEAELMANLSPEKRKSISKAAKDGIAVQETRDMEAVYGLVLQSLQRNKKDKNTHLIRKILHEFATPENSMAFVASRGGVPLSACFCVLGSDTAVYLFGGFDEKEMHHGAGVACMWQGMLKAKRLGKAWFDFEGSMYPGIERYFREFGGKLTPYPAITKRDWKLDLLMRLTKKKPG
jgi:hypothetical protein